MTKTERYSEITAENNREVDVIYNGAPEEYEDPADYIAADEVISGVIVA